jgi:hypothetical protein
LTGCFAPAARLLGSRAEALVGSRAEAGRICRVQIGHGQVTTAQTGPPPFDTVRRRRR